MRKKVISPEQRRRAARAVVASQLCSGRAACRFLKVSRSTYWYRSKEPTSQEQRLLKRLKELSEKHARYGYRRIAALLRQEGWPVGKRHVQRLRRSSGLRVPPTKRKVVRRGISTGLPTKAEHRGHVWSWDFISDATTRGGALRMLTILDEYPANAMCCEPTGRLKAATCLNGWNGPSPNTELQPTCGVTMVPSLSPGKSSDGWPPIKSRRSISSPAVRGKMASSRVSMDACATSASTGSSSAP